MAGLWGLRMQDHRPKVCIICCLYALCRSASLPAHEPVYTCKVPACLAAFPAHDGWRQQQSRSQRLQQQPPLVN
jgi:hypothetical protein